MSQGLLDAQNKANGSGCSLGITRRSFLKFTATASVTAGGGLLLGFSMPASSQGQTSKSVIGGDGIEAPQSDIFAANAFVQIDMSGKVTLVMAKVEMGQGSTRRFPC
jgi:isoquinoline 1-oxidoreductase beta subunit